MKILAFDSSAKTASVCVMEDDKVLAHSFRNFNETHSKTLLSMIEKMEISLDDIDYIAVNNGPGSYTGVRIAVSVAQGLALAKNLECVAVSTLESLAYNLILCENSYISVIMDARAGQVYNAIFYNDNGEIKRISDDRAITIEDLAKEMTEKSYYLVGDGAKIHYDYLKENGVSVKLPFENFLDSLAVSVAVVSKKYQSQNACELIPSYLRPSQAEREKNGV